MVVGYDQQRMLLSTSPTGISLVTHLPEAPHAEATNEAPSTSVSFADVFQQLTRKA